MVRFFVFCIWPVQSVELSRGPLAAWRHKAAGPTFRLEVGSWHIAIVLATKDNNAPRVGKAYPVVRGGGVSTVVGAEPCAVAKIRTRYPEGSISVPHPGIDVVRCKLFREHYK